ncbi:MAG: M23 family metallopeptidase [Alphaproteobacteria bacterium]|nr:M23 family metallopeptidase [Alphaproteobacteria bacterium]
MADDQPRLPTTLRKHRLIPRFLVTAFFGASVAFLVSLEAPAQPAGTAPPRPPTVSRPPVAAPTTVVPPAVVTPPLATAPRFEMPVRCADGECFVQNYIDVDSTPDARDYSCGRLTYDRHTGVDVRVANMEIVRRGIPVIASAPGVVRGVRDGLEDVNFREIGDEAVRGKECGNGVLINHNDGWVSQYCHLRKDSIVVQNGQEVKVGDRLGFVGMSGKAEFPHVHFEVRYRGTPVDPFTGATVGSGCDVPKNPIFAKPALEALAYRPSGLLNAGFSSSEPKSDQVLDGKQQQVNFLPNAERIYFWTEIYGRNDGDRERFVVRQPSGEILAQATREATGGHKARSLTHMVVTLQNRVAWPIGTYRGEYVLERKSDDDKWESLVSIARTMEIRSPFAAPARADTTPAGLTPTDRAAAGPSTPALTVPPASAAVASPPPAGTTTTATPSPSVPGAERGPAAPPPSPGRQDAAPEQRQASLVSSTLGEAAQVANAVQRAATAAAARVLPPGTDQRKGPPLWMAVAVLVGALLALSGVAWLTRR